MSLLNISVELDKHIVAEYPDKNNINLPDATFTQPQGEDWIQCRYNPFGRSTISFNGTAVGRVETLGTYTISCFSEYRKTVLALADNVNSIMDCVQLPNNVKVEIGVPTPPEEIDGLWKCSLNYLVRHD